VKREKQKVSVALYDKLVSFQHTCKSTNQKSIFISIFAENLPKALSEFHVGNSTRLKADDFLQNYQLVLNIKHRYGGKKRSVSGCRGSSV